MTFKLASAILIWIITGQPPQSMVGFPDHDQCELARAQIEKHLKPNKSACITIPDPHPPAQPQGK